MSHLNKENNSISQYRTTFNQRLSILKCYAVLNTQILSPTQL